MKLHHFTQRTCSATIVRLWLINNILYGNIRLALEAASHAMSALTKLYDENEVPWSYSPNDIADLISNSSQSDHSGYYNRTWQCDDSRHGYVVRITQTASRRRLIFNQLWSLAGVNTRV